MAEPIIPTEPDPTRGPVRKWADGTPPIADNLNEIRQRMNILDDGLVDELLRRRGLAIGATVFKATPGQVLAPERQIAVIERAVTRAKELAAEDPSFVKLVRAVFEIAVPGFVDMQAEAFERTIPIDQQTQVAD